MQQTNFTIPSWPNPAPDPSAPSCKTNPRRQFDETKLAELADNIRQHGALQPIFLRLLPDGEPGFFELVAGARRYHASKLVGRESIPATVRELTDTQCLELQLNALTFRGRPRGTKSIR